MKEKEIGEKWEGEGDLGMKEKKGVNQEEGKKMEEVQGKFQNILDLIWSNPELLCQELAPLNLPAPSMYTTYFS